MNVHDFSTITVDLICNTLKSLPINENYIGFILNILHFSVVVLNILLLLILKTKTHLNYLIIFNIGILLTHILFKKCILIKIEQCFTNNIIIDKVFYSFIQYFNIHPDNNCPTYNSLLVIIHAIFVLIKYSYV